MGIVELAHIFNPILARTVSLQLLVAREHHAFQGGGFSPAVAVRMDDELAVEKDDAFRPAHPGDDEIVDKVRTRMGATEPIAELEIGRLRWFQ